jgi:hypothetical protein
MAGALVLLVGALVKVVGTLVKLVGTAVEVMAGALVLVVGALVKLVGTVVEVMAGALVLVVGALVKLVGTAVEVMAGALVLVVGARVKLVGTAVELAAALGTTNEDAGIVTILIVRVVAPNPRAVASRPAPIWLSILMLAPPRPPCPAAKLGALVAQIANAAALAARQVDNFHVPLRDMTCLLSGSSFFFEPGYSAPGPRHEKNGSRRQGVPILILHENRSSSFVSMK